MRFAHNGTNASVNLGSAVLIAVVSTTTFGDLLAMPEQNYWHKTRARTKR